MGKYLYFEVVNMRVWEVVGSKRKQSGTVKSGGSRQSNGRTEFEKNTSKLRGKERKLNPQRPVAPVKHAP